jgi:hypothetical protein
VASVYLKRKKNERFDEKVGMLHCFVVEQWRDVVLLADRSYRREGPVSRLSVCNKKNERFDEKVGMLHFFF